MSCLGGKLMKKQSMLIATVLIAVASQATAATVNVPSGLVGLWLFQNGSPQTATIGNDVSFVYDTVGQFGGANTQIGTESSPYLYQDPGVVQVSTWGAVDVPHGIAPNGGGAKVNEYSFLIDYKQNAVPTWASLFDTFDGNAHTGGVGGNSDGELFNHAVGGGLVEIGVGDLGYSSLTYNPTVPHRIVVSADIGSFFRVYIDGVEFLNSTTAAAQTVDGRFSLAPVMHLLVDNAWEGEWGLLQTAMMWDRALTPAEVAGMGVFNDPNNNGFPTPLILPDPIPEPTSMVLLLGLSMGSLIAVRRKR